MSGKGLDVIPLRVPREWDADWFERFCREVLALADVRNAAAGAGITILSTPNEVATVSTSGDVETLVSASLITASASSLTNGRVAVAGTGMEIVDGGAGSSVTFRVHNIPMSALAEVPELSVLGVSREQDDGYGPAAAIVADSNDTIVRRVGDVIDFGQLTVGMVPDGILTYAKLQDVSTDARVLGLVSGSPAPPTELTLSDVLDFIGSATEGDILYRGSSGWERLPRGSDGDVLTLDSGVPAWAAPDSLLQATYLTASDETTTLVNSRQLQAGTGIDLDDDTPGALIVENLNP